MTFRVGDGEPDRLFPLDLVPRIVTAEDWAGLSAGLEPAGARAGGVPARRLRASAGSSPTASSRPGSWTTRPGWTRLGTLVPADAVRIAVAGIDLVRDRAERWLVLEDNLRVPSGIGYSMMSRRLIRSVMPDLEPPAGVVGLEPVPGRLRAALLSATEPDEPGSDEVALLSAGPVDSAYFEHRLLAEPDGHPAGHPARAAGHRATAVYLVGTGARRRLSALYRRIDEQALLERRGRRPAPDRPGAAASAVARGKVALLNALGNGVADDKLRLRLRAADDRLLPGRGGPAGRTCRPTRASTRSSRAEVLDRLDELVLKPVDGYGGQGIVIGPHADARRAGRAGRGHPRGPGRLGGPGPGAAVHPPHVRRRQAASRGPSTCGRSCCSPGSATQPGRGAAGRAEPGGARPAA